MCVPFWTKLVLANISGCSHPSSSALFDFSLFLSFTSVCVFMMSEECYHLKKTFSGGCAHGQTYCFMKSFMSRNMYMTCVIPGLSARGRGVTMWLYSCNTAAITLHVDAHILDQVQLQPCHIVFWFSMQLSLQPWVMFLFCHHPLWMETPA